MQVDSVIPKPTVVDVAESDNEAEEEAESPLTDICLTEEFIAVQAQLKTPWELADDDSKYMWRLDDTNNLNAWCEPRNANGIKVNGGPVPPLGSV